MSAAAAGACSARWGSMRLRIEIRSQDRQAETPVAALNLPASLVDLFSRTGRAQGYRVAAETDAFRMADLKAR
ncbi:MAG: hypothetical protein FJW40_13485 [Acidobacteria bacterium]|nr:hypothetical protein [Acidobacteriota bacterium]